MKKRLFTDSAVEPTDYFLKSIWERQCFSTNGSWEHLAIVEGNGNSIVAMADLKVHNAYKPLYYLIAFDEGLKSASL